MQKIFFKTLTFFMIGAMSLTVFEISKNANEQATSISLITQ